MRFELKGLVVICQLAISASAGILADYRLAWSQIPDEDCAPLNWASVDAKLVGGTWKLVDGNFLIHDFGQKEADARQAAQILKRYQINKQCFVGRPNATFTYWLTDGQSPAGQISNEDCVSFNPANVQASNPSGQWLMVDGAHSMFVFSNEADANKAVQIVQHYGFNRACFIGRAQPPASMHYLRK